MVGKGRALISSISARGIHPPPWLDHEELQGQIENRKSVEAWRLRRFWATQAFNELVIAFWTGHPAVGSGRERGGGASEWLYFAFVRFARSLAQHPERLGGVNHPSMLSGVQSREKHRTRRIWISCRWRLLYVSHPLEARFKVYQWLTCPVHTRLAPRPIFSPRPPLVRNRPVPFDTSTTFSRPCQTLPSSPLVPNSRAYSSNAYDVYALFLLIHPFAIQPLLPTIADGDRLGWNFGSGWVTFSGCVSGSLPVPADPVSVAITNFLIKISNQLVRERRDLADNLPIRYRNIFKQICGQPLYYKSNVITFELQSSLRSTLFLAIPSSISRQRQPHAGHAASTIISIAFDIFLHRFYVHSARNSLPELCPAYLSPSFLHPVLLFTIHEGHYDRDRSFLVVEGAPANVNCSTTLMRYSRVKPSHRQAHMVPGWCIVPAKQRSSCRFFLDGIRLDDLEESSSTGHAGFYIGALILRGEPAGISA